MRRFEHHVVLLLNGQEAPRPLRRGDYIQVGESTLVVTSTALPRVYARTMSFMERLEYGWWRLEKAFWTGWEKGRP